MTVEITTAKVARQAREAALDQVFQNTLAEVEEEMRAFVSNPQSESFSLLVPIPIAARVEVAYREAGWDTSVVDDGKSASLRIKMPAPVAGVHPERAQPGGMPILDFWRFVYERQAIYYRRVFLKQDRPWTEDPVLRERFFTNIFRDLDPGTQIAAGIVAEKRPAWERLWNLLVYRRFNREETWNTALSYWNLGDPDTGLQAVSLEKLREMLRERYRNLARYREETGQPIFTDAHQVYPMPAIPGPDLPSRFLRVMLDVYRVDRKPDSIFSLTEKLQEAKTRKAAYQAFLKAKIPGISNFLSWQMTMDCTYGKIPIVTAADDWAPITTGARFGAIMWYHWPTLGTVNYPIQGWPSLKSVPPKELETFVQGMRDEQDARFDERGLDFAAVSNGRRLDMPALEHALCEYQKYLASAVGMPTRDRFAQPVIRGIKAASDKKVQELAAKMDDAIKAIDAPGIKKKSQSKVDSDEGMSSPEQETSAATGVAGPKDPEPDGGDKDRGEPAAERSSVAPPPKAGSAEERFRDAIIALDERGEEPTPKAIFAELGGSSVSLNSRQAGWRRAILEELGYVKEGGKYVKSA